MRAWYEGGVKRPALLVVLLAALAASCKHEPVALFSEEDRKPVPAPASLVAEGAPAGEPDALWRKRIRKGQRGRARRLVGHRGRGAPGVDGGRPVARARHQRVDAVLRRPRGRGRRRHRLGHRDEAREASRRAGCARGGGDVPLPQRTRGRHDAPAAAGGLRHHVDARDGGRHHGDGVRRRRVERGGSRVARRLCRAHPADQGAPRVRVRPRHERRGAGARGTEVAGLHGEGDVLPRRRADGHAAAGGGPEGGRRVLRGLPHPWAPKRSGRRSHGGAAGRGRGRGARERRRDPRRQARRQRRAQAHPGHAPGQRRPAPRRPGTRRSSRSSRATRPRSRAPTT